MCCKGMLSPLVVTVVLGILAISAALLKVIMSIPLASKFGTARSSRTFNGVFVSLQEQFITRMVGGKCALGTEGFSSSQISSEGNHCEVQSCKGNMDEKS